ncbi:MAG: DnaJ C-terminal domain-containing protein, partial [Rikenellaceae bacterium]
GMQGGFQGGSGAGYGDNFNMDDIFDRFGDIFGGHFGGFGGGFSSGGSRGRNINRGSDLRVKVRLTLKEVAEGVDKKLKINKLISCDKCGGSGAKDSNSYNTCSTCSGSGYVTQIVNTFFGRTQTSQPCATCGGTGKIITQKCDKCRGDGVVKAEEVVEIRIPKGVGEGIQLSVSGKGNAAKHGGVNGDLLVLIEEEQHPDLIRDGNDLLYNLKLNVADAILGASVEVPAIDGKIKVKVDEGTQPGRVLRLRGKGLPDINGYGTGDFLIVVDIFIPKNLSKDEKKVVETISKSPSFTPPKDKREPNIFERMHSFFR